MLSVLLSHFPGEQHIPAQGTSRLVITPELLDTLRRRLSQTTLGKASATGVVGEGPTSFATSVSYQSTFPAGIQEGVLALYAPSNANGSIAAAVMQKVLINAALKG